MSETWIEWYPQGNQIYELETRIKMTKLRSSRLTMEVAPPRFVSVTRCRVKKMLDTIKEEENDFAADKRFSSPSCGSSSLSLVERPVLLKNF
ncbi:hypothetical protein JHK87_043534 [Glycine soja]|nr:hypothetical protein JHK87_043534 [Glycine soja]